ESQREELTIRNPEVAVESLPQLGGLMLEALGQRGVSPDLPGKPRRPELRVVDVPLELARSPRGRRERPVAVEDRAPGVRPALASEAGSVVPLILDVPVAVAVGMAVEPLERRSGVGLQLPHELRVPRPALVLVEQDEIRGRGVVCTVVRRVRALTE